MKKVLFIDEHPLARKGLALILETASDLAVFGQDASVPEALKLLESLDPDVIILDLEMPKMDGITFLEKLNEDQKYPIIVVSNYASDGSEIVNDAMILGAVDSLMPPPSNSKTDLESFKNILRHKITKASLRSSRYNLSYN